MIKLIALDMDGTLLDAKKQISQRNYQAIQDAKKAGITVVLASGRPIQGMQYYLDQLGLTSNDDFVVSYNGSLVQRVGNGEVLHKTSLKGTDAKAIFEISQQLDVYIHAYSVKRGLITHQHNTWTNIEATLNGLEAHEFDFNDIPDDEDIIKVMMVAEDNNLTTAINNLPEYLKEKYTVVRSAGFFLEFLHPTSNKGIAVEKLCVELGLLPENAMCVGDAENDHAMIQFAGLGVAMENADPETKALANYITKSNLQDGVAVVIEEKALSK